MTNRDLENVLVIEIEATMHPMTTRLILLEHAYIDGQDTPARSVRDIYECPLEKVSLVWDRYLAPNIKPNERVIFGARCLEGVDLGQLTKDSAKAQRIAYHVVRSYTWKRS